VILGGIRISCFGIGKHDFTVECDRSKGLERVGENGIEIGLKIRILCAKGGKQKIGKIMCC